MPYRTAPTTATARALALSERALAELRDVIECSRARLILATDPAADVEIAALDADRSVVAVLRYDTERRLFSTPPVSRGCHIHALRIAGPSGTATVTFDRFVTGETGGGHQVRSGEYLEMRV